MENTVNTRQGACGGSLFAGVFITAMGVIFLLGSLDIIEVRDIFRPWVWPLILIVVGIRQIVRGRRYR